MKPSVLFVAAVLCFTGCASKVWYQPGRTAADARQDLAKCKMLAAQQGFFGSGMVGMIAVGAKEGNFVHDCMEAKGYQWVPVNQATNYPKQLGDP